MEIEFMQPPGGRAVAQFDLELFFEIPVKFDSGPMNLAGLSGIFQDRKEQIPHTFQFGFTRTAGLRPSDQGIDSAAIEQLDPQPHHSIAPTKLKADSRPRNVQQEGAPPLMTGLDNRGPEGKSTGTV